jgi:transposase
MLFVGDDWAEDHHDIEIQDEEGRRLARARLPEGVAGLARLHELIAEHLTEDDVDPETGFVAQNVVLGIETDRGAWVAALAAAGYRVFAINPMSVARYRERHATSGAKSDRGDAHVLAEIVRLDRAHHRPVAGDSPAVEGLKLVARSHQAFIWDRTRHQLRLRSALREFFPAALEAFSDLLAPEALELLERAPDPAGGPAVAVEDHRRPPPRPPPRSRSEGGGDPGRAAGPGAAPGGGDRGRLRGHRGQRRAADRAAEHPDRRAAGGGGRGFWPAPGR